MHVHTALFTLAFRHRDVRISCERCGHGWFEAIDRLVSHHGPMYPVARLAEGAVCRKCGDRNMRARPG